ncbi:hypothetical protein GCM10009007_04690 [Formosimonas limnophila]|uniref:Restriction endonuclease type IV Mrr domain-containing protein n=1 Tax=Formosimonas limnophila TaxID=1384487 RepID=A0A8J3FXT0_9BURK|nr:restriction endonuclease [Formosimonas limnophila]GHA67163.1 hypothetical protein GCM10009007_04690 [Formosimonas limnophila]
MTKNTGKAYEEFVGKIYQALIDSEVHSSQQNICVETNKKIIDRFGQERQFDVYWEYELGGIVYKSVIECKDYNSSITIEKIDALIGKLHDLPDITPIFATTKGYQSGAKNKAEKYKINLLIVREQNDDDWQDSDGNPYVKQIRINLVAKSPARITKFSPVIDQEWIDSNHPNLDISQQLSMPSNQVFIEDVEKNEKYSLHELQSRLRSEHVGSDGSFDVKREFKEAYLHANNKLKLRDYLLTYEIYPTLASQINIDFSKELLGVIEYLQAETETKTLVFKDKVVKNW